MSNRKKSAPAVEVLPPVAEATEPSGPFVYVSYATVSERGAQGYGHQVVSGLADITTRDDLRLVDSVIKQNEPGVAVVTVLFWRALEG